jgi:hypothetical protein
MGASRPRKPSEDGFAGRWRGQEGATGMFWAATEAGSADFGDARLAQRLVHLLDRLSEPPTSSIPHACGTWAPTKAAYQFFDNPRVTAAAILAPPRQQTVRRAAAYPVILAVQDTTVFNLTLHRPTQGLGPIGQAGLSGFFRHSCLAVSPDGVPLGLLGGTTGVRPPASKDSHRPHKQRHLADKESRRGMDLMDAATADVPPTTRVILVADREADIFDVFSHATATGRDVLVRAAWDRRWVEPSGYLGATLAAQPVLGTLTVAVPRHDDAPTRMAVVTLRRARVMLRPPPHRRAEPWPAPSVTAVWVREASPPEGTLPIEWLWLTPLPVEDLAAAEMVVRDDTYRWRIERYHDVLKSGCPIEDLPRETFDRVDRALVVYRLVAWRLLWLTYLAREQPETPCTTVLRPAEWAALYAAHTRRPDPPRAPGDLPPAVRGIAQLGGFRGQRGDGEPGVKTLWRGYRHLEDLTVMWEIVHPPG